MQAAVAAKEEHMRFWCGLAILLVVSGTCAAQERDRSEPDRSERVADKKFWLTAAALNVSMVLDTKSTFDVVSRCARCFEANPFAAPFIARGPVVAYAAGEAFDAGVMLLAAEMKGAKRPLFRRTWWLVPLALSAGHMVALQHNVNVAR